MKASRLRTVIFTLLCGSTIANADILVLKNGNRMEGTILQENAEAIRMKYRLTPKIWDEKTVMRTEIQQVIKQRPEEIELIELRKVVPLPDLTTADKYEQLIQDRLRPFANRYKGTKEAAEVEEMITQLQEEKSKVASGGVKVEGKWLTPEEAKKDDYNVRAFKLLTAMRQKAAGEDWVGALREFDKFYNPRTGFPGSVYFPVAIEEAKKILDQYEPIISQLAVDQPEAMKQRTEGLKRLVEPDLSKTKAAISKELSGWKATYDAERRSGVRWLIPYKYDLRSLEEARKLISTERARLLAYDMEALVAQSEKFTNIMRALASGDLATAEAGYVEAEKTNTANNREFAMVLNDIRGRAAALRAEQMRRTATLGNMASGPGAAASQGAGVDDRVARILAQANGPAGQPGAAAPGAPGAATAPTAGAPGTAPAAAPGAVAAKPPVPQAAVPPTPAAPPEQAYPQEESNIQTYLLIGAGLLIVVLLVALMSQKKKKDD